MTVEQTLVCLGYFRKPGTIYFATKAKRNWKIFFSPTGAGAHRGSRRPSPPSSGGPRPPSAKARFDLASSLNIPFVRRNESRDRGKAAVLLSRSHIHHSPRPGVDWQSPIQNAIANHGSPTPLLPTQRGNPPPPPLRTEASRIYRRVNAASPVRPLFFLSFFFFISSHLPCFVIGFFSRLPTCF